MSVCCSGVLEVLNSLLSSGEVPGLFTPEELSKELASLDSKRDKDPHYKVLLAYLVIKCTGLDSPTCHCQCWQGPCGH
jgi:hypothetical protein